MLVRIWSDFGAPILVRIWVRILAAMLPCRSLPCRCHVTALPLPCRCHAPALLPPCRCHIPVPQCPPAAMSLQCPRPSAAMSLPCYRPSLPCPRPPAAMSLPCDRPSQPYRCHVAAMSLPSAAMSLKIYPRPIFHVACHFSAMSLHFLVRHLSTSTPLRSSPGRRPPDTKQCAAHRSTAKGKGGRKPLVVQLKCRARLTSLEPADDALPPT